MTPKERQLIAEAVAKELAKNPELDADTIKTLKDIAKIWNAGKATAGSAIIVTLVVGMVGIFFLGVVAKLRGWGVGMILIGIAKTMKGG